MQNTRRLMKDADTNTAKLSPWKPFGEKSLMQSQLYQLTHMTVKDVF